MAAALLRNESRTFEAEVSREEVNAPLSELRKLGGSRRN
jgi:hypothetical protein